MEVFLEISLTYPYNVSVEALIRVVNIFRMRLIYASTISDKAIISVPIDKYKLLFKSDPKIGKKEVLVKIKEFVNYFLVIKIEEEVKNGENK
jgi:hypothetical protein